MSQDDSAKKMPPYMKKLQCSRDLMNLNIQQLSSFKQHLDQELGVFQESLHALKIAQSKYQESGQCLEKITPSVEGKEILVPLTGSMYVPGKLADANSVIVDIGTGYYAQKSTEDARNYFKRRVDYVTEQMEKIQEVGIERNKLREAAMDILEKKLQAHWETAKVARHRQRF